MIRVARWITVLNRKVFQATKWLVFLIAALMLWEVVSRYSFASPTSWAPELATLLFGPFFLLGGPHLLHLGGHVAVDVLSERASGKTARSLAILALLLAAAFGAILLWFSLPLVWQAFEYRETSYSAWNPQIWPSKIALPLAAVLLVLQSAADGISLFANDGDQ